MWRAKLEAWYLHFRIDSKVRRTNVGMMKGERTSMAVSTERHDTYRLQVTLWAATEPEQISQLRKIQQKARPS